MANVFRFALLMLLVFIQTSAYAIEEGTLAPALSAKLLDGKSFSTESAKGEVVIVNFWATWCLPCWQEMPALQIWEKIRFKYSMG